MYYYYYYSHQAAAEQKWSIWAFLPKTRHIGYINNVKSRHAFAVKTRVMRCPLFHTSHRNKNPESKGSILIVLEHQGCPCNNCETWTTLMDTYQEAPRAQVPECHARFQCLCASRSHLWINTHCDSQKPPRICHNISTAYNGEAEFAIKTNAICPTKSPLNTTVSSRVDAFTSSSFLGSLFWSYIENGRVFVQWQLEPPVRPWRPALP